MSEGREITVREDAEFTERWRSVMASGDELRRSGYYAAMPNTPAQDHRTEYNAVRYDRYRIDVMATGSLCPVLSSDTRSPFRLQACACVAQCVDLATRGGTFERDFDGYVRTVNGRFVPVEYDARLCTVTSPEHRRFHEGLAERYAQFESRLPGGF